MKKLVLTLVAVLVVVTSGFSQKTRDLNKVMCDSLWASILKFTNQAKKNLDKDLVTKVDVNNFLKYVYENMEDSVQSTTFFKPTFMDKSEAFSLLTNQTKDLINNNCSYKFVGWTGWNGNCPYTLFNFNIHHNGYDDQFLVVLSTKGKISCIFSVDSKIL